MNLTNATLEVRARLQELSANFWTADEVMRAINEGVNRFAQEEKWPYLYTASTAVLLAGDSDLPLTAAVAFERHFSLLMTLTGDARPRSPRRVDPAEGFELRQVYWTDAPEPIAYFLYSTARASGVYTTTVRFVPSLTRDADVDFQYIRNPVEVSSGSDYLDLPNQYAMGAVAYATGHLFLKELRYSQKADEQFALYRKSVEDAKRELRKMNSDSVVAWGRNEPELRVTDNDAAYPYPLG